MDALTDHGGLRKALARVYAGLASLVEQVRIDGALVLRRANAALILLLVCLMFESGSSPTATLDTRLDQVTSHQTFDFVSWELQALSQKIAYGLLSPHRFIDDTAQSQFVMAYLADIRESDRLMGEIDKIYTDPDVEDPAVSSATQQAIFAELRERLEQHAPVAEAILESQVSEVLAQGGIGPISWVLPPVKGTFTPLPHVLIVSPRARIETVYQEQLVAGLTAADQVEIETRVVETDDEMSAYVTDIGGLAAYPAMLLEYGYIDWVTDVMSHEWVHHYLSFYPLGWNYMKSGEARTINETTASVVGEWAGQEVVLRFYAQLLPSSKRLPGSLSESGPEISQVVEDGFDFRAEMHETRVRVDELLAEGRIEEAEAYMEARRRDFVAQGYRIRILNQAYFAFHGAYAASPRGAAGADPIGPLVRKIWATSQTPVHFLRSLDEITTLEALREYALE